MKKVLLFAFLLMPFYLRGQSYRVEEMGCQSVSIDTVKIFNGDHNLISHYMKLPDVLYFGLSADTSFCLGSINFRFSENKLSRNPHIVLANQNKSQNRYSITWSIVYRSRTPIHDFTITYNSRKVSLKKYVGSRDDLFADYTEIIRQLNEKLKSLKNESLGSNIKCAIIGEIEYRNVGRKHRLNELTVSEIIHAFSKNNKALSFAKLIPWDSTRDLSFKNLSFEELTEKSNAGIFFRATFQEDQNADISIQPNIYIHEIQTEISLNSIILSYLDAGDYVQPLKRDFNDLIEFLIDEKGSYRTKNINQLTGEYGNDPDVILDRSEKFYDSSNYFMSLFLVNKAIKLKPDYYRGYADLAAIRRKQDRYSEALIYLDKAVKLNPDAQAHSDYFVSAGSIYEEQGQFQKALTQYKKARRVNKNFNSPDFGDVNFLIGNVYYSLGSDSSIVYLKESLNVNPTSFETHYLLGLSYYQKKNYEAAINDFKYVYKGDSNYKDVRIYLSNCYYELSVLAVGNEENFKALELVKESILYYDDIIANTLLWRINIQLQDFEVARELVKSKISQGQFKKNFWREGGNELVISFYKNENLSKTLGYEAIRYYQAMLEYLPNDSSSLYSIGNIYASLNENEKAVTFLEKAITMMKSNPSAYLDLAEVYIKSGRSKKVTELLQTAPKILDDPTAEKRNKMMQLYLITIANRLSAQDYRTPLAELENHLKSKEMISSWSYKSLKDWVNQSSLVNADKTFILNLTKRMEKITYAL